MWRLACERGSIELDAWMTPAVPSRVQIVEWKGEFPPEPELRQLADRLAALIGRWDERVARTLFAPSVAQARAKKDLAHLGLDHGACAVEGGPHSTFAGESSEAAPLAFVFSPLVGTPLTRDRHPCNPIVAT